MRNCHIPWISLLALLAAPLPSLAQAQDEQFVINENPPKAPSPVERLGPTALRIGNVRIDTEKKELTVTGVVREVNIIEFIAVTKGGYKAYESALELDTNAINLNVSLILIGLDPAHAVSPKVHMDQELPKGDPVEIWVEWREGKVTRKIRAEELVYNSKTKSTLATGPWVYTGSVLVPEKNAYLADINGALIGFAHSPGTVIDSPRPLGTYGNELMNPKLGLKAGTPVTLTVRAMQSRSK